MMSYMYIIATNFGIEFIFLLEHLLPWQWFDLIY